MQRLGKCHRGFFGDVASLADLQKMESVRAMRSPDSGCVQSIETNFVTR
ncbi:hypothetical protein ATH84_101562 [Paracoccus versutus]|uniref:Uncharacterized protein n=1 Tax=Paracoccus versutus TaxID=34007 RepID=A0AAQ0HH45_PARVE|nr:hypothetical protein ATH84_101562 [Paracoccus versutus]